MGLVVDCDRNLAGGVRDADRLDPSGGAVGVNVGGDGGGSRGLKVGSVMLGGMALPGLVEIMLLLVAGVFLVAVVVLVVFGILWLRKRKDE